MSATFIVSMIALSIALLIVLTVKIKLHPFFALTISAFFFGITAGHSIPEIITAYSNGLGGKISGIGVVIAIGTVMGSLLEHSGAAETMANTIFIGLIIAFFTYKSVHSEDKEVWTFDGIFGEALKTAGQIVLIVGAGGAFATVLRLSNLQDIVMNVFAGFSIGIIVPYIIGAIFRTAIGSGTVGMITAASMLLPLLDVLGFNSPMGLVIAMLACAAGGFMVFHGNDDFFWVTVSTSDMKPEIAYKVFPLISIFQSIVALICVYILKIIFL